MEYTVNNEQHATRIYLSGQFTFTDNHRFKQILELLDAGDTHALALDFSEVGFIDSAGLGMLLLLRDECEHKRIPISIHAPRGQVERIFVISKFDQLFSIHS